MHASTLRLLDELGLAQQLDELPHRLIESARMQVQGVSLDIDFARVPGAHKHIALVPQWDFLQMLATAAEAEPSFRLLRDTELRAKGIEALHRNLVSMMPWLADRVDALTSFDDVKLLDVQVNRLRRWYYDGLLRIGDAAHARSPVGGVGINLAVADAVAAARILAKPLRAWRVSKRQLARVRVHRWIPTAILQALQRMIHANVVEPAVGADAVDSTPPAALRRVTRIPLLRQLAGYLVAFGPLSEHAPKYARR